MIYGYSQEEAAKELGCTVYTYNRKENGKAEYTVSELKKIAEKYNTTIDKLVDKELVKNQILNIFQK